MQSIPSDVLGLQQTQLRADALLTGGRLHELHALLDSLAHRLTAYYRLPPKNVEVTRALHRLRKRQELVLLHNHALLCEKQEQWERATDLRTALLQELMDMLQGEQTRLGFLENDDQKQREQAQRNIALWEGDLIRHYYFLAAAAERSAATEIALAALMKGLDLVREAYRRQLQAVKGPLEAQSDPRQQLVRFEQAEELTLLWQLRERVDHSKFLNIVSSNTLLDALAALTKDDRPILPSPFEAQLLDRERLAELELPPLEEVAEGRYVGPPAADELMVTSIAHTLYLGLLARIYAGRRKQSENEYQNLRNAKNVVFLEVLQTLIARHYLPPCPLSRSIIQQHSAPRQKAQLKLPTLYSVIELFGFTPEGLSEHTHTHEETSFIHHRKPNKQKTKKAKSNSKGRPISHPKSKPKEPGTGAVGKPKKTTGKGRKERVREEYMQEGKRNHGKGEDHLLKAISQNYRSFDSSRSKDKPESPFRRAIRTETCIPKPKDRLQPHPHPQRPKKH